MARGSGTKLYGSPLANAKAAFTGESNMFTYEHGLPCKNPNCKSNGKPHPNCKCYGALAEGGEIGYCNGPHKPDCQYFYDGEEVQPNPEPSADTPQLAGPPENISYTPPPGSIPIDEFDSGEEQPPTGSIPVDQFDASDYPTEDNPVDAAKAFGEGALQGLLTKPAAIGLEQMAGRDPEDIKQGELDYPIAHGLGQAGAFTGSMMVGTGEVEALKNLGAAPIISNLAMDAARSAELSAKGAKIFTGSMVAGLSSGLDSIGNALLGIGNGDKDAASTAALNMGFSTLVGGIGGGVTHAIEGGIDKMLTEDLADWADDFNKGIGCAAEAKNLGVPDSEIPGLIKERLQGMPSKNLKTILKGADFYANGTKKIVGGAATGAVAGTLGVGAGAATEYLTGSTGAAGWVGAGTSMMAAKALRPYFEDSFGNVVNLANPWVLRSVAHLVSENETAGMPVIANYVYNIGRTCTIVDDALDGLFKSGPNAVFQTEIDSAQRDKTKKFIEQGGVNKQIQNQTESDQKAKQQGQQYFAEGGEVKPSMISPDVKRGYDPIAAIYPKQAMHLSETKGRVSAYLGSMKPSKPMGMNPFDTYRPDKQKEREYDRAIDLANKPLNILSHIKDGTLTPAIMKNFTSMYPDAYQYLSGKLSQRVVKAQLDGEKPDYHTRQGMSMFLGKPLDSTMTPQSMQSIQMMFSQNKPMSQAQPQGQEKPKKGSPSKLGKIADNLSTPDQSRTKMLGKP